MQAKTGVFLEQLERRGVIVRDSHVVYASGLHGTSYIDKDAIYPDPYFTELVANLLADPFRSAVTAVVGPALGGIVLAQYAAASVTVFVQDPCLALYAEKDGSGGFVLRRGNDKRVHGRDVLVVEDVLTTGASARKVVQAVRVCGGTVVGVAALVNRGAVTAEMLGVPRLHALLELPLDSWSEASCALCAQGVPVNTEVGHGASFLTRHGSRSS